MIYNGKQASENMQIQLKERITRLGRSPVLAIVSVAEHPTTQSFIRIKRNYAEKIGVTIREFNYPEEKDESALVSTLLSLSKSDGYDGIIVQLPLPSSYNTRNVLDAIPEKLDVDVLGSAAVDSFEKSGMPIPPVAGAIVHILSDTRTEIKNKNVVVIGRGRLVGMPITTWFTQHDIIPQIVDIDTEEETKLELYKEADIVISGAGTPHLLKPEYFKQGVVLIDAGTSEQGGVLSGDCDPSCADIASIFTPVPGGVGPLTVACLFDNVIASAETKYTHNGKIDVLNN